MSYYVYILKCADGSYYTGSTDDLSKRLWQHQEGVTPGSYTIKGWSRAKKEALIRNDFEGIHEIVKDERKRREAKKRKNKT